MGSKVHFKRGQVWYVDDDYRPVGSIQGKSRPYLVVSNDTCNRFSPVIHMAPITTKDKKLSQPTHIQFFNPRSKQNNWVLLEQTMPKSVPDIINVSNYHYTLSAETMQEVDKALAIQFALKSFGVDVSDFEVMLDMIVEQKIAQIQEATQSMLDSRISKYVERLLDRVADAGKIPDPEIYVPGPAVMEQLQQVPLKVQEPASEPVSEVAPPKPETKPEPKVKPAPEKKAEPVSAIDKFNAKWGKAEPKAEPKVEPKVEPKDNASTEPRTIYVTRPEIDRTKTGRIRWNDALKQQFLLDMASYGPKEVSKLWDMDVKVLYTYRYKFAKEFEAAGKTVGIPMSSSAPQEQAQDPPKPKASAPITKQMLKDFDEMPISAFMQKYNINTRAQAVEFVAKLKVD